ncbi:sensor histidine kinase [Actinocrispum sp. NPDC049592]|uniref:sensor histidine kinase n=1 Tax=Actinocrispum sp. NPDC049592 TaxID=3154835 RepID=UPI003429F35F
MIGADGTRGGQFAHPALFYRDDTEYLATTIPFITNGLDAGEPVAAAVPPRQLKLLRTELGGAAEHVRFFDMAVDGRNPGRIIPNVLHAFADEHRTSRVRIIGEPLWDGRTEIEYPACVQHEALVNLAFAERDVTIMCPYDSATLTPHAIADAAATHSVLIDANGTRDSVDFAPERIAATYNRPLPAPEDAVPQPFEYRTLSHMRRFLRRQAESLGVDPGRLDDVVLAVTELATNTVEHGPGSGVLHVWTDGDDFVCQVSDTGQIFNPLVGRIPATPEQIRGRGVLLVNYLADLVRMYTGPDGTTFRTYFIR